MIAEVYPSLWKKNYWIEDRTADQHDAYSVSRWMREKDLGSQLPTYFQPLLNSDERKLARLEGWILGLV